MSSEIIHRIHPQDNVAVALVDLIAGAVIPSDSGPIELTEPIAFGHKLALADIPSGAPVVKYGEQIGLASRDIRRGQHVHVHNVASTRGRGDLPAPSIGEPKRFEAS